jgi:hypothetical protein
MKYPKTGEIERAFNWEHIQYTQNKIHGKLYSVHRQKNMSSKEKVHTTIKNKGK